MEQLPKVFIGIPHMHNISVDWMEYTYAQLRFFRTQTPPFLKHIDLTGGFPVDAGRNKIVYNMLKDGGTHVFFIDSDVLIEGINPNDAIKEMLDCDLDIVSGLCRIKAKADSKYYIPEKNTYAFPITKDKKIVTDFTERIIEVDQVGMACCLIKREVFETIPRPWFEWTERHFLDLKDIGEDVYFCMKAKHYGFKIHVLTSIRCTHIGTFMLKSDGTFQTIGLEDLKRE